MYRLPQEFYNRIHAGKNPLVYMVIHTYMGYRLYSGRTPNEYYYPAAMLLDGSWLLDGSVTLGISDTYASKEALVLEFDRLQRTLSQRNKSLLTGYASKRQSSFAVSLNNADRKIGKLMAAEPFITRPAYIYLGFDDIAPENHICLFKGTVDEINITRSAVQLTIVED